MVAEEEIARAPLLDEDFRKIGFTGAARGLPRDDLAFSMVCAFCGYDPDKAPDALRFFPNESMKAAWGHVAALLQPAIDAAVAGERERCAKVAEDDDGLPCRSLLTGQRGHDYDCGQIDASGSIAAAIRSKI